MGDNRGFTLIEVLVALFIMSIGFLALSQMQYLSLKQSQLAYSGTTATNISQAFSDSDLNRMRSIHSMNMALIEKIRKGTYTGTSDPALVFCKTELCNNECPCDPFSVISDDPGTPTGDDPERICTAIKNENYTFDETIISDDSTINCNIISDDTGNEYFLTRTINIDTSVPQERTYNIAYTIKNRYQQTKYHEDLGNSLSTHFITISAHVDITTLAIAPEGITNNLLVFPNIP